MNHIEAESVRQRVRELLEPDCVPISRLRPLRCVVVGGTIGALARLILARRSGESDSSVGGMLITLDALTTLSAELLTSSHDERLRMPGMETRRADLVPAGALILKTVLRQLGVEEITVCDWGLREGVFLLETLGA
jgi:exopolyphosphatase/guanosine-5'-triphosphate,3'-diphosphate pyrophosphatase